jgi:hypothetical protein
VVAYIRSSVRTETTGERYTPCGLIMTEQADPNNLVLNPKNVNRSTSFGFEPKDVLRRGDGYTILDAKLDNMITSGHHAHVWGGFGSTCRVPPGTYLSDDGSLVTTKNSNIIINHGGKITNMGAHVANICGECTNVRGRTDNYFGTVHNAEGFVVNNGGRVNNFRGYVENNLVCCLSACRIPARQSL